MDAAGRIYSNQRDLWPAQEAYAGRGRRFEAQPRGRVDRRLADAGQAPLEAFARGRVGDNGAPKGDAHLAAVGVTAEIQVHSVRRRLFREAGCVVHRHSERGVGNGFVHRTARAYGFQPGQADGVRAVLKDHGAVLQPDDVRACLAHDADAVVSGAGVHAERGG